MNSRQKTKEIMQRLSIKKWDEIKSLEQFKLFVTVIYEMSKKDLQKILPQISDLKAISEEYFNDVIYTIANHEPALMYELEEVKVYIEGILAKGDTADYAELAEVWIDFSSWLMTESAVDLETAGKHSLITVCEALELAWKQDQADGDEDSVKFVYGFDHKHEDYLGECHFSQSGADRELEELLNEFCSEEERKNINSRLN